MRKKKNEPAGVTVSPTNNTILFGFIHSFRTKPAYKIITLHF